MYHVTISEFRVNRKSSDTASHFPMAAGSRRENTKKLSEFLRNNLHKRKILKVN